MKIGIGLPTTIPGTPGRLVTDWAREAERHGFTSVATIDRLRYPSYEPLTALAAAAAVTERIALRTAIWLPLLHGNAAAVAKQVASVDALSGGRLRFGIAVGDRPDDFEHAGVDYPSRGKQYDAMLAEFRELWADGSRSATVPAAARREGPPILIGGSPAGPALRRLIEYGSGWIVAGGAGVPDVASTVKEAWSAAGKPGSPTIVGLAYFGIGPSARERALDYLGDYYRVYGAPPEAVADHSLLGVEAIQAAIEAQEKAGAVDELILSPVVPELDQVAALAEAAGLA